MPGDRRRRSPAAAGDLRLSAVRTSVVGRCRDCASVIHLAYDGDNNHMSISHAYPQCPAWLKPGVLVICKRDEETIDLALGGPI